MRNGSRYVFVHAHTRTRIRRIAEKEHKKQDINLHMLGYCFALSPRVYLYLLVCVGVNVFECMGYRPACADGTQNISQCCQSTIHSPLSVPPASFLHSGQCACKVTDLPLDEAFSFISYRHEIISDRHGKD